MVSLEDTLDMTLEFHDWYFEFSDDFRVYSKGVESKKVLSELIRKVDEDTLFALLDKHLPCLDQINLLSYGVSQTVLKRLEESKKVQE